VPSAPPHRLVRGSRIIKHRKIGRNITFFRSLLDEHAALFDIGREYVKKVIDPTHKDFDVEEALKEITKPFDIDKHKGFDLPADGTFVLGWTAEYIKIPVESRLAARVEGKSSLARLGIGIHVTAPTIHAGFDDRFDWKSSITALFRLRSSRECESVSSYLNRHLVHPPKVMKVVL
jgi:deoxycytidine triphosphate deaminase